jgi:hypothetical protein
MKRALIGSLAAASILGGVFGGVAAVFAGQGEGHTPRVVCHWVPAHGGSFIRIVVDDDGADGNKALAAHLHHEHDVIDPVGGVCPSLDED